MVGSDDGGMRVEDLEAVLRRTRVKLIYLVPTFQNPRGTTLPLERRLLLVRLAAEHGVPVLEDAAELGWAQGLHQEITLVRLGSVVAVFAIVGRW